MRIDRRDFIRRGCAWTLVPAALGARAARAAAPRASQAPALAPKSPALAAPASVETSAVARLLARSEPALVNDVHSQLNATTVDRVFRPTSNDELREAVDAARALGKRLAICGGRHSMGGQQFGSDAILVDMRGMNRVLAFDAERGVVDVEAGIEWPELLAHLDAAQKGQPLQWGIVQKQTGADRLSLGGALSSNVHGRGLAFKPIVDNVESFTLLDAAGAVRHCSRDENPELFRLAIGGYGLFGIITSVRLRLWRRRKVRRVVELREIADIPAAFERRIADGYVYGDFQFAVDGTRDSFLRRGVFSCYQPVDPATAVTENPTRFRPEDWAKLTYWIHRNKRIAFDIYSKRYLKTSGQIYWSDWQLSAAYIDNYHAEVDRRLHAKVPGSEMITEIYVPRESLVGFMADAARMLREREANVIYGTVRLIERDDETFLPWAKGRFACVIFNLHVDHTPEAIAKAADAFRGLIDLGIARGGSYYLTYHRFATREQVEACYPRFREFLALKLKYDPRELFQSDWYRHYRDLFAA